MSEIIDKLIVFYDLNKADIKRSELEQRNKVIWTILSFLPALVSCGVCYLYEKRRYKCLECVFVLCNTCAPKLRHAKCPHCQRANTFPKLALSKPQSESRRSRRRSVYVYDPEWADDPFGHVFTEDGLPLLRTSMARFVSPCPRCGLFVCGCTPLPPLLPPPPPPPLALSLLLPPPPPPLPPPPLLLPPPPLSLLPLLSPPLPPPLLPLLPLSIRTPRVITHSSNPVWRTRNSSSNPMTSGDNPLLAFDNGEARVPIRPIISLRGDCRCSLAVTLDYVCPYGAACRWRRGLDQ